MATANEPELRDVAILTRAVENVFRKLIRILVGKISLKKLQEMIQVIFVEEAEAMLKLEKPGKNEQTDSFLRNMTLLRSIDRCNDFLKAVLLSNKVPVKRWG